MGNPKLNDDLRAGLIQAAGSVSKAADNLGIAKSSVRGWLSRNEYPEVELLELARLAGLSHNLDSLRQRFEFRCTRSKRTPRSSARDRHKPRDLVEALGFMDNRLDQFVRYCQRFGEDVSRMFGSMGKDDLFIHLSLTGYPFETEESGWAETGSVIARAIDDGARFVYLYPSDELAKSLRSLKIARIPTEADFQMRFTDFRERLCDLLPGREMVVQERLVTCACNSSGFMIPGHTYTLFKPHSGCVRALGQFPTGNAIRPIPIYQLLDQDTTDQFSRYVAVLLERTGTLQSLTRLLRGTHASSK